MREKSIAKVSKSNATTSATNKPTTASNSNKSTSATKTSNKSGKTAASTGSKKNTNTTTTTTITKGNKSTSTTVTESRPGAAWVQNNAGKWVQPPAPSGDFSWDDNDGWVSSAAQADLYKVPLAIIQSDPELTNLFNEAWTSMKNGMEWTKEQFNVRLQSLNWYKSKSASQRAYYTLENDPAQATEFNAQIGREKARVSGLAESYGTTFSDIELTELAKNALRDGLNDTQVASLLTTYISYGNQSAQDVAGSLFGKAGTVEDTLRDWAKRNGVAVSDSWVLDSVRESAKFGSFDPSKAKDSITAMAKQQYSHWADKLDGINSLDDLAAGFKNIVSQEMDIDYRTLGMDNKWIQQAMQAKDDKGQPIVGDSLRKTLYKSDEWADVTKNANKIMGAGRDILTRMGM